jgi:hypothetical protein
MLGGRLVVYPLFVGIHKVHELGRLVEDLEHVGPRLGK